MNKDQALGQFRALLTAIGTVLVTWGITDGNQWAPVIGILVTGFSLTWGLLHHKDPQTPGRLSWSLFRKFVNVAGAAALTYGFLKPERFSSIAAVVAALGPLLAARYSWIDNSEDDNPPPPAVPLWIILGSLVCFFPSCTEYPIAARVTYNDPQSGSKAGLEFVPGKTPTATLRTPIIDPSGNLVGYVDLRSGK